MTFKRQIAIPLTTAVALLSIPGIFAAEEDTKRYTEGVLSFEAPSGLYLRNAVGFDSNIRTFQKDTIRFSYEWTFDLKTNRDATSKALADILNQWRQNRYPDSFSPKRGDDSLGAINIRGHVEFASKRAFTNYLYLMCESKEMKGYLCLHIRFADSVPRSQIYRLVDSITISKPKS